MKDSIVAMSGAIMPAPLEMPLMVTSASPSLTVAVATFGYVSVVMMAFAASVHRSGLPSLTSPASRWLNLVVSSGSPMTPVDARKTSPAVQPAAFAAASPVSAVDSRPFCPVKALALPELTTSTRALPEPRFWRQKSTGAEGHFDLVNTPATAVPASNTMASRSVRPLYFIPASAVAMRTPSMAGIFGYFFGASGEIVVDMQTSGGKIARGRPVCPIRRAGASAFSSLPRRPNPLRIKLAFQIRWRRRGAWRYDLPHGQAC